MARGVRSIRSREPRDARSDAQLAAAIRRGEERAFDVLYERYFRRIHNFAYARLRNRADAEEVVQETFTAVFHSIEAYRAQSSLLSWIYGIAKNTVNSRLRRAKALAQRLERAEGVLLRSPASLDACSPEDHLSLRRSANALAERLASISDWQLEVFALRHLEDVPIQEIAQRMSRSNDAIRSSLYRVKQLVVRTVESAAAGVP